MITDIRDASVPVYVSDDEGNIELIVVYCSYYHAPGNYSGHPDYRYEEEENFEWYTLGDCAVSEEEVWSKFYEMYLNPSRNWSMI